MTAAADVPAIPENPLLHARPLGPKATQSSTGLCRTAPADLLVQRLHRGTHKWQKPLMSLALYIMSAAISMRRILYMSSYKCSSSSTLVSTTLLGASIL